jgi:hypothetical protein
MCLRAEISKAGAATVAAGREMSEFIVNSAHRLNPLATIALASLPSGVAGSRDHSSYNLAKAGEMPGAGHCGAMAACLARCVAIAEAALNGCGSSGWINFKFGFIVQGSL